VTVAVPVVLAVRLVLVVVGDEIAEREAVVGRHEVDRCLADHLLMALFSFCTELARSSSAPTQLSANAKSATDWRPSELSRFWAINTESGLFLMARARRSYCSINRKERLRRLFEKDVQEGSPRAVLQRTHCR
jgi:hypothetical protein